MKYLLPAALLLLLGCGDDAPSEAPADASKPQDEQEVDAGRADAGRTPPPRDATVQDTGSAPEDASAPQDARTAEPDAGSDAGMGSDAGPGGAARCTGSGLKFCDDFEGTQIESGWQNKQGMISIDGNKAMRGEKSLHARGVNGQPAIVAHRASFPMPNDRFWMRMFVNIKNLPTPDWAHWSVLWVIPEGSQWSVVEHRIGGQNQSDDKLYWGVGSDHGDSGDWTNIDTSSTVQLDRWQCLEVFFDTAEDVTKVYREGVEIPGLGTTRNVKHGGNKPNAPYDIPTVRAMYIGFMYYQAETPNVNYDVWIDSFALDGERIGCTR